MSEFHKPFIESLIVIATATLVSVFFSPYFVEKLYFHYYKTPVFTSSEIPNSQKTTSEISFEE